MKDSRSDIIFCLHGLGNSKYLMSAFCLYLSLQGFHVINLPYPSTKGKIDHFSEMIAARISHELKSSDTKRIHLLGFSLGSQIFTNLLSAQQQNIGFCSLLMIGPPNQGSDFARWLKSYLPTSKIWGPVFEELCEARQFKSVWLCKTGIIAGGTGCKFGFNPFLKGDNDGIVKVSETFGHENMQHKLCFCPHFLMAFSPQIWKLASRFFKTGNLNS